MCTRCVNPSNKCLEVNVWLWRHGVCPCRVLRLCVWDPATSPSLSVYGQFVLGVRITVHRDRGDRQIVPTIRISGINATLSLFLSKRWSIKAERIVITNQKIKTRRSKKIKEVDPVQLKRTCLLISGMRINNYLTFK